MGSMSVERGDVGVGFEGFAIDESSGLTDIERVRLLRYVVLREPLGLPYEQTLFPGDEFAGTTHFVGVMDGEPVGCLTLLPPGQSPAGSGIEDCGSGSPYVQLRGMAVVGSCQGRGIGSRLLAHVAGVAAQRGWILWCKARESAVGFYAANGWRVVGEEFEIPQIGKHRWMVSR